MRGRRIAALLCVLLGHAGIVYLLLSVSPGEVSRGQPMEFVSEPITMFLDLMEELEPALPPAQPTPATRARTAEPTTAAAGESTAVAPASPAVPATPGHVDWPIEGQKSVARILAREAEAERVARMFAGPGGTWASLTKRQRSKLSKFTWRPGVDGLEYDDKGNAIYRLPNGCFIVNAMFFGCRVGKENANGNMFDNMREYFDEQRLPQTPEGNGTEPEALRPAN